MNKSLREIRKESDLKTNEIAYKLNIQASTLYSWENSSRLIPINQLHELLNLYNFPINEFDFDKLIADYEEKRQVSLNGEV